MVNVECYAHKKYLLKLKMKTSEHTKPEKKFIINRPALKDTFKKILQREGNRSEQKYRSTQKNKITGNGDNVGQHTRFFYYFNLFKIQLTFKQK